MHGERLQEWLPEARDWPLDLASLNGQVRAWGRIENGRPSAGQVRLSAPAATLTDGEGSGRLPIWSWRPGGGAPATTISCR
ncbi:hypothetical protein HML84_08725 [Alcanivorax sp. IO_7]|nr:hypothetical protein HML84_08725 [Alcanivorax sp. IO_7]